jgi:hypothetical protein
MPIEIPDEAEAVLEIDGMPILLPASSPTGDSPKQMSEVPRSAEELVEYLLAIKQRLIALWALWCTNLSVDLAAQIENWRERFQELAVKLEAIERERLQPIVARHAWLMEPIRKVNKPTIPTKVQAFEELRWAVGCEPRAPEKPKHPHIPDGLGIFVE